MFIEKKIHSPNKIIHSQKGSLNKERMIEMIRKSAFLLLVVVLCLSLITPASAQIGDDTGSHLKYPVVDDSVSWTDRGEVITTYTEDGYFIKSHLPSKQELELAELLSKPHIDYGNYGINHFSLIAHLHSIRDIVSGGTGGVYRPDPIWTRNNMFPDPATWPSVTWTTSQTYSVAKKLSLSVGVTDTVITGTLGADYTTTHTVGTSYARSWKVPYMKDGRVIVTWVRPTKWFTCVTKYYTNYYPYSFEETGSCSAQGAPANIVSNLETRNF